MSGKLRWFMAIAGLIVAKDRFILIQTHHNYRSKTPSLNARTPKVEPEPEYKGNSLKSGVWMVSVRPKEVHCNCKTDHIQRLIQTYSDASSQQK